MSTGSHSHHIVIIGWDGATFDLIHPWVAEGKLPNIAAFLKAGTSGLLRSTNPPVTYPAWTSFITGKNPGKHGIFDFSERIPGTRRIQFVNARSVRSKSIWRLLSDAGLRVASMGLPVSYPAEPVNGVMICGFDAPGSGSCADSKTVYPPELLNEVERAIGRHYITSTNLAPMMARQKHEEGLDQILNTIETKAQTAKYLLKREAWDVFMVLFGESDLVGHYFWRFTDPKSPLYCPSSGTRVANAIYEVYAKLDALLADLLEACPPDAVRIMVSDHGFGGSSDRVIYMNKWLADEGFLTFQGRGTSQAGLGYKLVNLAKGWGLRFLPPSVRTIISRRSPSIPHRMESYLRFGGIDWSKTKAFSEELPYVQNVWINVKGREPDGIVEPGAQYDELVAELRGRLSAWVDPLSGEKVVDHVYHRDELYEGPRVGGAPDLLVRTRCPGGYTYHGKSSRQARPVAAIERIGDGDLASSKFLAGKSGSHRDDGIFLIQGPMIPSGRTIQGARLMDVAPTILYLLGQPIPEDMDGVVLRDCVDPTYIASRPVVSSDAETQKAGESAPTYSAQDEAVINQRLQDLGYLE